MEERKILLQIAREKKEKMSFTTNELTHLEFRALTQYLETLIIYFKKELEIDEEEEN